jgi:methionine--tRNA ligase beta chain
MEFEQIDLRAAKVLEVENHPNADKLYVLKILAIEEKQLVAGLKAHYSPEELKDKTIIIVNNLQPAKLRGIESMGMLLACEHEGKVRVLETTAEQGTKVQAESITPNPSEQITISEFFEVEIKVKDHKAMYKTHQLMAEDKEVTCELNSGNVR